MWIVDALQEYAENLPPSEKKKGEKGKKVSHTTIANKIWQGKIDPINTARACWHKKHGESGRKGVSMPEWLWLAIKIYAERRDKGELNSFVAGRILIGKIPPVPKDCIEEGERQAHLRENERETHGGKEPPKRDRFSKAAKEAREVKRKAEHELKGLEREEAKREKEKRRAQLAKEKAARAAEKKHEREKKKAAKEAKEERIASSISSSAQEEVLDQRAREKLDERGNPLSKGESIDTRDEANSRTVNPDDDFYGGVFNM